MSESLERLARNQSLFRAVNEKIEELADGEGTVEFVCECSDPECVSLVELRLGEYERIRSDSTWFFVKAGHVIAEIERVVSEDDGYVVVEKLIEREYAEEVDSRSDDAS
jgi:hypothetical protein